MSISLTRSSTQIILPSTIAWPDRYAWAQIVGTVSRGLTGRNIVQTAERYLGRDITLQTAQFGDGWCGIVSRTTVEALKAVHDLADEDMTLVIDAETFTVRFNRSGTDAGLLARPLFASSNAPRAAGQDLSADPFAITLRFYTVA